MLVKDSNGRECEISVYGRFDDDIQIDSAVYTDDGTDVPDDQVEFLYDHYASEIYEHWFENQIGAAESYYEGDR